MGDAERFRLLVSAVRDYAIYMLDPAGYIVSWNAGAERFKGYRAEEVIGRHFSLFYTPEDQERGIPALALETARTSGKFETEGWRMRKDGGRFWAHVVIDPITGPAGNLVGFAKITRDLTERRDAQEKLEKAREALFQSQKMEAIGQFTGGVAHDFNNLLAVVLGGLELVQRRIGEDDPQLHRLLDNIRQAAQRGANLTQRMLAFARRQELKPELIDICAQVRGMVDLLDRSLGPDITLATRFPRKAVPVLIDPTQLEMAVLNLAVNGRDAMPGGGTVTIEVATETLDDSNSHGLSAGSYALLSVIDHGMGMDEDTVRHAIEPFFSTKGIGKGTGLGLSMVHGLAEQSGGRLVLRSTPGKGTRAILLLPLQSAIVTEGPEQVAAEASASPPLNLLVVDDDALVLMSTAAMLEEAGHSVTTAYSGQEALKVISQSKPFDVLVTDQGMPSMTGQQLIQRVRAQFPQMAVILATGYAETPPGLAADVIRLGKPFLQEQLLRAVRAAKEGFRAEPLQGDC
ncbi:PAS domain-containing sensor histidine kinase [Enhydrobacter sp.]|uniref:PAS domain-containing sensor histidine kinase n=1 Tax=Enhydrobacter sp. TaxID=1894999 RepID=UPI0026284140|nr:PAS domain-containing sensor histidine kinase [Enhydrobacter sp.]